MDDIPRIDLLERCKDALLAAGFPAVKLRPLTGNKEGVSLRRDPSTVVQTYMNGVKDVQFILSIYARYEDEGKAADACDLASRVLERADLSSQNGSYDVTSVREYSGVRQAEIPTGALNTYVVGMRIDITTKP